MSLTLALPSVQKKLEDANPSRKTGLRKRGLAHSNKISQYFNDFFLYDICLHQKIKIWKSILWQKNHPVPKDDGEGNGNPVQYSCLGNPMAEEPGGDSTWVETVGHNLATKPPPPPTTQR